MQVCGVLCVWMEWEAGGRGSEHAPTHSTRHAHTPPLPSIAHYNLGIILDRLGDWPAAVAAFSAAIALAPTNADYWHNRGFSLRKMVSEIWAGRPARARPVC